MPGDSPHRQVHPVVRGVRYRLGQPAPLLAIFGLQLLLHLPDRGRIVRQVRLERHRDQPGIVLPGQLHCHPQRLPRTRRPVKRHDHPSEHDTQDVAQGVLLKIGNNPDADGPAATSETRRAPHGGRRWATVSGSLRSGNVTANRAPPSAA